MYPGRPLRTSPRALIVCCLLTLPQMALASDGYVTTDFARQGDYIQRGAVALDGSIVSFGSVSGASTDGLAIGLTRHLDSGFPDIGFGTGGKAVVPNYSDFRDFPTAGLVLPDGKLIVAGTRSNRKSSKGSAYWLVVRLNANGSLDKTFNKTGYLTTAVYNASKVLEQCVEDAVVQSDGKIVVAGYYVPAFPSSGGSVTALARYNANGTLDSKFGSSGIVKPALNVDSWKLHALAQQDAKILAVGWCFTSEQGRDLLLMRFNADGSLDSTFHGRGIVRLQFPEGPKLVGRDVAILPDGRIIVGVEANVFEYGTWPGLVCFDADGNLATDFGFGGLAETHLTPPYDDTYFNAMALHSDGRIVVTATQLRANGTTDPDHGTVLLRYWPDDGSLDNTFGEDGVVVDWAGYPGDVRVDSEDRLVVLGRKFVAFPDDPDLGSDDFFVARYLANGAGSGIQ